MGHPPSGQAYYLLSICTFVYARCNRVPNDTVWFGYHLSLLRLNHDCHYCLSRHLQALMIDHPLFESFRKQPSCSAQFSQSDCGMVPVSFGRKFNSALVMWLYRQWAFFENWFFLPVPYWGMNFIVFSSINSKNFFENQHSHFIMSMFFRMSDSTAYSPYHLVEYSSTGAC